MSEESWPTPDIFVLGRAIGAGLLDDDMWVVIEAVNRRMGVIDELRKQSALAAFALHDRVRFADNTKPQYLRGATDEIHEFYEDKIVVCLDRPLGGFKSGHVRCPPQVLERIEGT
ncbi:MAG: hypothetical protein ACRDXC_12940 [Acidimicrobiales bacterium]